MQKFRREAWEPAFLMAHAIYPLVKATKIYYKVSKSKYLSPVLLK